MVQGTFVLSVFVKKGEDQKRVIKFRQTGMRYVVVLIAIFVVFGCEYCFDNASALQIPIKSNLEESGNDITQFEFNLLYSLYAFPNVIIPLFGGILIDKYGARIVLMLSAMFCVFGHIIFGFGGFQNAFSLMLVGRVVFGIGGQVLHASQNTLISNWFKASQLSMVLGICLSFPKMGSSLNSFVTPKISGDFGKENHLNVAGPIFVGAIIMSISLVLAVVLAYIDRKSQKAEKNIHQSEILSSSHRTNNINRTPKKDNKSLQAKTVEIVESQSIMDAVKEGVSENEHLNFKNICKLPFTFWLIIIISMFAQSLFIPFLDNGNEYYVDIFGVTTEQAGLYLILPYCASSLFVVIFGYLIEKVQKRSYVLMVSCFFFTFTYLFMIFTEATEAMRSNQIVRWMPSFLLGICIAIFCSIIVPTIPMLVPPHLLGTGFGIMEMLQNLALGVFPLIGGFIREAQEVPSRGFHLQTLFFFLISCLCFGLSLILKAVDLTTGEKLDVKDFRKIYLKQILQQEVSSLKK